MYLLIIKLKNGDNSIIGYHKEHSFCLMIAKDYLKARYFEIQYIANLQHDSIAIDNYTRSE